MAHGCIPISTRVGSQDEVLPDGLLVPLAPRAAVAGTVAAVDAMYDARDAGAAWPQGSRLQAAWTRLTADPTAEEALMPIYRRLAQGDAA